ncbi:hypothetical protein ACIQXM_03695 [Arthrobacter sp. NPDC097144]|uniref:hypothetical protein n=1 Tax=Arthrobacter sp. NPDC097144 TaxID=3363946 RepID=UPI0037FB38B3
MSEPAAGTLAFVRVGEGLGVEERVAEADGVGEGVSEGVGEGVASTPSCTTPVNGSHR